MPDNSELENRFKFAQYILRNGYTPREKIKELERLNISLSSIQGETENEHRNRILYGITSKF